MSYDRVESPGQYYGSEELEKELLRVSNPLSRFEEVALKESALREPEIELSSVWENALKISVPE